MVASAAFPGTQTSPTTQQILPPGTGDAPHSRHALSTRRGLLVVLDLAQLGLVGDVLFQRPVRGEVTTRCTLSSSSPGHIASVTQMQDGGASGRKGSAKADSERAR